MSTIETIIALAVSSGIGAKAWEWYKKRQWSKALIKLGHEIGEFEKTLAKLKAEKKI